MQIVDGNILYIADSSNHRIVIVTPDSTNATATFGSFGTGVTRFKNPTDIFVTRTSIYILDATNYRVQLWPRGGSSGTTVAGATGNLGGPSSLTNLGYSFGIFVDRNRQLYVVDTANHRVLRFPPDSIGGDASIRVAGNVTSGSGSSQLSSPSKVFVDDVHGHVIVDKYFRRTVEL